MSANVTLPGASWRSSATYILVILLTISAVQDIQLATLLPLLGKMTAALHLTSSEESWAVNSSNLATAAVAGLCARFADIVGHKKVILALLLIGAVGSFLCATAGSFGPLLAARIILGLALPAPMSWAMYKIRTNEAGLERAAPLNGAVIAAMTPLSLILGGVLLSAGAAWNSFFWVIGAGYVVLMAMAMLTEETPKESRVHVRLDWVGSLGLAAWLLCILLGLSFGSEYGWGSPRVVGLLTAGVVILCAWAVHQRHARAPLMDFRVMNKRQVASGYTASFVVTFVASGLYIAEPAFTETPAVVGYGFGASVLIATLALSPLLPTAFLALAVVRRLLPSWGPKVLVVCGGVITMLAFLLMAAFHGAIWEFYVTVAVYGLGVVIVYSVTWSLTAAAGRRNNMSTTFGIFYAFAIPSGAVVSALAIAIMASNQHQVGPATFVPKEGAYTGIFLLLAGAAFVGFMLNGLLLVPRRLQHQAEHAKQVVAAAHAAGIDTPEMPADLV
jgi:MFS family permease